mgnify:CR=1 FL=1
MALQRRHRMQQLALVVGMVVVAALLGATPAVGDPPPVDESAAAPVEIVELELGEILETTGPRVSPAFPGRATGPTNPDGAAPPATDLPIAPESLAESVIGVDERVRVADTTVYPHRAIGQLDIVLNGQMYYCTGWLIDRNTVVTAGHCAYNPGGANDPIDSATFVAGRNHDGVTSYAPYGYCPVNGLWAPYGWRVEGKLAYDWAIMQLDCSVGTTVGWFGMYSLPGTNRFAGTRARVQGYPMGDPSKPPGSQWRMADDIHHSTGRRLFYPIDTSGGQSGGPAFKWNRPSCGGPCVMGIHTYGTYEGQPYNSGTRITASVFDKIISLRSQNG